MTSCNDVTTIFKFLAKLYVKLHNKKKMFVFNILTFKNSNQKVIIFTKFPKNIFLKMQRLFSKNE